MVLKVGIGYLKKNYINILLIIPWPHFCYITLLCLIQLIIADITTGSCKKRLTFLKYILSDTSSDQKWASEFGEDTEGHQFSLDYLLDTFIVLYDECSNSSLRREKGVSDFLKLCK